MPSRPYKRPESVLVVVYTLAGEVLMLRRRQPDDFWQSVTGSLEWDETPAQAARRELLEETGLDAEPVDCHTINRFPILPAWRARYAPEVSHNVEHVFCIGFAARPDIRHAQDEHLEAAWLPRDAAAARASSYTNRDAILACVPACK